MLLRSTYALVAPVMLIFAALACGTVITDTATFTCPTAVPEPGQPIVPPVSISAPQDFYVGDAVFVGQPGAPLRLRFRLLNVQVQAAGLGQRVTWRLEIHNLGTIPYETIPAALMLITRIMTANGEQVGSWRTSAAAMQAAGFTGENYDPLPPGSTRVYRLAASIPTSNPSQLSPDCDAGRGALEPAKSAADGRLHHQPVPDRAGVCADYQPDQCSLRVGVGYAFIVALLVLGLTYLLAALIRLDVVSPRNALTWYAAGALFFSIRPSLYQGMNDFRLNIAQVLYVSVLDGLNMNSGDFPGGRLVIFDGGRVGGAVALHLDHA